MTPPSLGAMLACVGLMYLCTYGVGSALSLATRLRLGSAPERFGVSCALGAAVLGWVGYLAAIGRQPLAAVLATWLFAALGAAALVWGWRRRRQGGEPELSGRQWALLVAAALVGLLFAAGMQYGQVRYNADGSMAARFLWPDLLYRNALVARYLNFDGPPDWPWLAGVPLKGMSILRYTALTPVLKALGISSDCYQVTALWLGLYGIPVAACAGFAFFRALGAGATVSALAVLLTGFCGNPRWLFSDRFAHSPALHWAGSDVFAMAVPVLFALLALVTLAVKEKRAGVVCLAVFLLVSGPGFAPWKGLSVYAGVPLALLVALARRKGAGVMAILALGAVAGLAVLRLVMGTGGSGGGSPLSALAPSEALRHLSWAIPFLGEPLRPLLAHPGPINLMKLAKFAAVFPWAVLLFLLGSLWVRVVLLLDARNWRWEALRQPEYALAACYVVAGVLLSTVVDFRRLSYNFAGYDALRILWPALLLANLGVATLAVRHQRWLRTRWGLVLVALFLFYGSWENTQLVVWSRTGLQWSVIPAPQMSCLRYLSAHAGPQDVVLIDNYHRNPPTGVEGEVPTDHPWGYVSGLLNARLYLDNHDMAWKFGQWPGFEDRWQGVGEAVSSTEPAALSDFLRQHDIRWVLAEGEAWRRLADGAGLRLAFAEGGSGVYERAAPFAGP